MEYGLGTIQVNTELQDKKSEEVDSLFDVTNRYRFLKEKPKEHLYALFLKSNNEVIGDKLISLGRTDKTPVDIKDIARTAVLTNAAAVILIHNHPSQNNNPSQEDKEATQEVKQALQLFNIELLDHVIISQDDNYSMKDHHDF